MNSYSANKHKLVEDYARYLVSEQILSRDLSLENDKASFYGFQPVSLISAIMKDGTIKNKLFEFKQVNHFLREKKAEISIDIVKCLLLSWLDEDKNILSFDVRIIDEYMRKLEKQFLEKREKDKLKDKNEEK